MSTVLAWIVKTILPVLIDYFVKFINSEVIEYQKNKKKSDAEKVFNSLHKAKTSEERKSVAKAISNLHAS